MDKKYVIFYDIDLLYFAFSQSPQCPCSLLLRHIAFLELQQQLILISFFWMHIFLL